MKQLIKPLIPPILVDLLRKFRNNQYGWQGDYKSWEEASNNSTGYDTEAILLAVKESLLKVKNGEAVYERDSVLFNKIQYSWPILSGLLLSAINTGRLSVIDFGGSLGSSYFQNKIFLDQINNVSWSIVEQRDFVSVGRECFADERLKFFYDIDNCMKNEQPNVLLLSSVLQYIEEPYNLLDTLFKHEFEYVLIDRTPFSIDDIDKVKLQVVPPTIYDATYPCWFFSKSCFMDYISSKGYRLVEQFDSVDGEHSGNQFIGMVFKK